MVNANTRLSPRLPKPVNSDKLPVVTTAALDELINRLAALSLDDPEFAKFRDLGKQEGKVDHAVFGIDGRNQNIGNRKVKRLDASLDEGWESTPLPVQRGTEEPRMFARVPIQPDKTRVNKCEGFYTSTRGKWVNYSDFIPGYLQPETQLALRREMIKPISESDESGYVYAYLIEDDTVGDDTSIMRLKIGRAVNVQARLSTWKRECGKKKPKLIGWYPGNIEDERLKADLSHERFEPGEKSEYCHRLERLVHIELGDLAIHAPYLDTYTYLFGRAATPAISRAQTGKSSSSLALNVLQKAGGSCERCKRVHKEVFPFVRPTKGPFKDREWEMIIKPVIRRWGRFIKEYL